MGSRPISTSSGSSSPGKSGDTLGSLEQNLDNSALVDLAKPSELLNKKYLIVSKIAAGSYGQIYLAKDQSNEGVEVAVKMESTKGKVVLPVELMVLRKYQGSPHAVKLVGWGCESSRNFIAMQLLGSNLNVLRRGTPLSANHYSGATAVRLFYQCVQALWGLHNAGIIHRDIKPANFAMGLGDHKNTVYLLDFGLSRFYRDHTGNLRPPRPTAGIRGTLRFCSIATLKKQDMCRKDDLISLFYMFVDIYRGKLPWSGVNDHAAVIVMKENFSLVRLSADLPNKLKKIATHIEALTFFDDPDYEMVLKLLKGILKDNNFKETMPWDWEDNFSMINSNLKSSPTASAIK